MKSKVIYVDFINKSKKSTPSKKSENKSFITVLWEKLKGTMIFTTQPVKNTSRTYTNKNMM